MHASPRRPSGLLHIPPRTRGGHKKPTNQPIMSSFLAKAMLALSLPVFLAHAQDAALCGNACDTYQLNLKNTDDIYTEDVLTPGSPITGADVLQMCGDFSEFSLDGSTTAAPSSVTSAVGSGDPRRTRTCWMRGPWSAPRTMRQIPTTSLRWPKRRGRRVGTRILRSTTVGRWQATEGPVSKRMRATVILKCLELVRYATEYARVSPE
ncbi:hypothetical protein CLAIMM_03095 [Cladophialophora immunda]|nr:hypothetical protein CLAIMM_03095 [Cladophialophora immunda]